MFILFSLLKPINYFPYIDKHTKRQPRPSTQLDIYQGKDLELGDVHIHLNLTDGALYKDLKKVFEETPDKQNIWLIVMITCGPDGF